MTKLYPIGTQLITFRKSQAALYKEIFGKKLTPLMRVHSKKHNATEWLVIDSSFSDPSWADAWRVTVTEEEQKPLSPVPIDGDLVSRDAHGNKYLIWQKHNQPEGTEMIEKRTYPNGQREPLIVWDEVILP